GERPGTDTLEHIAAGTAAKRAGDILARLRHGQHDDLLARPRLTDRSDSVQPAAGHRDVEQDHVRPALASDPQRVVSTSALYHDLEPAEFGDAEGYIYAKMPVVVDNGLVV